jgi:hypothetical protein
LAEETIVDFAAVGRISKFAELENIRLTSITAKCSPTASGPLQAEFKHDCVIANRTASALQVEAIYHFIGRSGDHLSVEIDATYLVAYAMKTTEALADSDISEFASANGKSHSWPFMRELLYGITSRMDLPQFTLGVMHFVPKQKATTEALEIKTDPAK